MVQWASNRQFPCFAWARLDLLHPENLHGLPLGKLQIGGW